MVSLHSDRKVGRDLEIYMFNAQQVLEEKFSKKKERKEKDSVTKEQVVSLRREISINPANTEMYHCVLDPIKDTKT